MAWLILVGAGLLEIVWATALKDAEGFTRLWPSVVGIVFSLVSFVMLAVALKSLPVGTAYAVWTGIGAAGTAVLGMLFLHEAVTVGRIVAIGLIIAGVVGLNLTGGH